MIDIYLLEQLAALYEYGTLSAAAEQLHIAQPSVSRSMQKIENILGVTLFDRQKNKVTLNETGKLAAEYAIRILNVESEMQQNLKAFERSLRKINIGSCAPGPLMELLPLLTGIYSGTTISSDIAAQEHLLGGLDSSEYTAVILNQIVDDEKYFCFPCSSEQLYLSVTPFHPAAAFSKISFEQVDGQNFIMYSNVGFWEDVVKSKMPHSNFFRQENLDAVSELVRSSDLPSFSTDVTQRVYPSTKLNRINVPFSDSEAFIQYYIVCLKAKKKKLSLLFEMLKNDSDFK